MATLKNTTISDSGSLVLPASTSSNRPVSPVVGQLRLNTNRSELEIYRQNRWQSEENKSQGLVLDSLVLHLDAGDPQSYPGTGNTWFDLSGNNHNATFLGGAVYNSAAGGSVETTSTSQSVDIPYTAALDFGNKNELTIETWVYITNPANGAWIVKRDDWDYGLAINTTSGGWRAHRNIGGTIYYPDYQIGNFPVNRWYHIVQVFNALGNTKLYVNGQLQSESIPQTTTDRPLSNGQVQVIKGGSTLTRIAQVRMYDRLLSRQEVIRNFKATQQKFGVITTGSGLSPSDPAPNAVYIKEMFGATETGYYWISSRTIDTLRRPARPVFCDMYTNGGGWMLMLTLHGGPQGATGALNHYTIQSADPVSYEGFVPRRYGGPTQSKGVSHAYTMFRNSQNYDIMKTYSFWNGAGTILNYLGANSSIRIPFDTCETGRAVTWNNIFGTAFATGSGGGSVVSRTLNNLITVRADNGFIGAAVLAGSTESIINFADIGTGFPSNDADPIGTTRFPTNSFGIYSNARHWLVYSTANGTNAIRCQPTCWGSEDAYQENSFWIKEQD